jgi:hypothetical protein
MNGIYTFQKTVSERLLVWSSASVLVGLWLLWRGQSSNRRGFGQQALIWGLIDAAIALFGWRMAQQRSRDPAAQQPEVQQREAGNLRRLLWINSGLDILYIAGGWLLARRHHSNRRGWRGHGWGVVVQGAFLLVFDLYHALCLSEQHQEAPQ